MHSKIAAIFAAGLAAQQAAATGWPVDAPSYSCPSNTNNQCSSQQQSGYDWSGLQPGSFSSYGSNAFSGFKCGKSFNKRDGLTKRTFQNKCILGDLNSHPSISCHGGDSMSIDTYQVSTSHDTDVDCHYGMPDGSTCRETHPCSAGGNIVKNTQCGGATSVTFKPRGGQSDENGSIGIHSIGFNCGSASSTSAVAMSTSPVASSTTVPSSYASTTPSVSPAETPISASISSYDNSSSVASAESSSSTSIYSYGSSSSPSGSLTSYSIPSYGVQTTSSVGTSPVTSSAEVSPVPYAVSSSTPVSSGTEVSPVPYAASSSTPVTSSTEVSPVPYTASSSTPVSSGTEVSPVPYAASSSTPVTSSAEVSPVPYGASSSTPVTSNYSIPSYGSSTPVPASYGTGVSSSQVSAATGSSSSPASPVASSAATSYPTPNTPHTLPSCLNTWLYETGCKDNTDSSCYCKHEQFIMHVMGCISSWSGSDSDTSAAASYLMGICAEYVPSNPAIITACPSTVTPAATPSPYTQPSASEASPVSSAPVYSVPAAPSTITLYSTSEITVTSCGAEVTNCPASSTVVYTSSVAISTTVTTPSAPAYTPPAYTAPASSPVAPVSSAPAYSAPAASSPAPTAPASYIAPVTTITYSSSVVVPCTYSTGESRGFTIPSSSSTTTLITTVTVPQVQFTSSIVTMGGTTSTVSVGLAAGCPSSAAAAATAAGAAGGAAAPSGAPVYPTSFGTSYAAGFAPSATAAPLAPFKGAGAKLSSSSLAGLALGAVAAVFML